MNSEWEEKELGRASWKFNRRTPKTSQSFGKEIKKTALSTVFF